MSADPRVAELEALAKEEGIKLPYPPDYICWLEDRGRMVDLVTGEVIKSVAIELSPHHRALSHLYGLTA